MYGSTIKN